MCSVRDENPNRSHAKLPALQKSEMHDFWAPIDGAAGGTWWAVNELGHIVILLNGAFKNHLPNNRSFRKSRGLIVKELAEQTDLLEHWELLDLIDIEPFTLVIKQNDELYDCRWDGNKKHRKQMEMPGAYIWSSAPLYAPEIQLQRELLFNRFVENNPASAEDLLEFLYSYTDKENGFIMDRFEFLRSLSISVFLFTGSQIEISYKDLVTNEMSLQTIQTT